MVPTRFENATRLRDSGDPEAAATEFHLLVEEVSSPEEKVALLINEHRCWCDSGHLDQADIVLDQIRRLNTTDPELLLIVSYGEACSESQKQRWGKALQLFENIRHNNKELLDGSYQYLRDAIDKRRGLSLFKLDRPREAIAPFTAASSSATLGQEDKEEIHFYLGICYEQMSEPRLAREQFQIAISLGVASEFEAHARYRISLNYFRAGAFAQAKYHLEKIIQSDHADTLGLPRRSVYEQLYRTCMELGDAESSEKYHRLSTSA